VEQVHGYLDFNRRQEACPLQATDGSLEDIATKVAEYFRAPWRFASEYSYAGGDRRFTGIAFRSRPAEAPPIPVTSAAPPSSGSRLNPPGGGSPPAGS
jgi:hypothetical protein